MNIIFTSTLCICTFYFFLQTAVIQACGIVTEHMRKDKGGSGGTIINVSSIAGVSNFSILYKIQSYRLSIHFLENI